MKEHNLLVGRNQRLKAKRDNQSNKSKPRASRPNERTVTRRPFGSSGISRHHY